MIKVSSFASNENAQRESVGQSAQFWIMNPHQPFQISARFLIGFSMLNNACLEVFYVVWLIFQFVLSG